MPSLNGGTDDETYSEFVEHVLGEGHIDDESEALEYCIKYTLSNKYGIDV